MIKRFLIFGFFLLFGITASGQTYTFKCITDPSTMDADADSCEGCAVWLIQSRSFDGLLIYKDSVPFRWIEIPYTLKVRSDTVDIWEHTSPPSYQGRNKFFPDRVSILLGQTNFATMQDFLDSTFCNALRAFQQDSTALWYASDSIDHAPIFRGDTLTIVGRDLAHVSFDSLLQKYVIQVDSISGTGGGTVTSFSSGNLSPLFTTNVATPTTTPALTFAQVNQNANLVFAGPSAGAAAAPTFRSLVAADINTFATTGTGTLNYIPKWTPSGTAFGLSQIFDDGSGVGINTTLHVSGNARVTGAYYDSNNDPGTNTQILSSTATGTDWVAAPAAPTILTVSNGLTLMGTNAKWGGSLIENTTIDGDGFYQLHKDGRKEFYRYNTGNPFTDVNVTGTVDITGKAADPSINIAPSEDNILTIRGHNGTSTYYGNAMFFGTYTTATFGSWIQTRSESAYTTHYPLNLNVNGGKVGIGRDPNTDQLDAHVTVSRSLSGSTITGILMHLENTEGNKSAMSFGKGYDVIDGELGYFDSDDIVRLTNRNTANLSSSIRFAIGGETSDRVVLLSSTAASNARLGVGFTNTTGLNSTMHSKGSIAGATLVTSGSPTFDETKFYVAYTGAGNQTYTLPAEADVEDRIFWIENYSAAGIITLSRNVKKANGASFNTIDPGQHAWFISDGVDYRGYKITSE